MHIWHKNLHKPCEVHQITDFSHVALRLDVYLLWQLWMMEGVTGDLTAFQTFFLLLVYWKPIQPEKKRTSYCFSFIIQIKNIKQNMHIHLFQLINIFQQLSSSISFCCIVYGLITLKECQYYFTGFSGLMVI